MKTDEKMKDVKKQNWWDKFQDKHPKIADFAIKAVAVTIVVGPLVGAYIMGYNKGYSISPAGVNKLLDESKEESEKEHQKWVQEQREAYLENWSSGKYADNERQFEIFCENIDLQPGEAYFIWDDSQFKGEDRPVEMMTEHQVYGIVDPKYQEENYNPWEPDVE